MKIIILAQYELGSDIVKYLSKVFENKRIYNYVYSLEYDPSYSEYDIFAKVNEAIKDFPGQKITIFTDARNGIANEAMEQIRCVDHDDIISYIPNIDIQKIIETVMNADKDNNKKY